MNNMFESNCLVQEILKIRFGLPDDFLLWFKYPSLAAITLKAKSVMHCFIQPEYLFLLPTVNGLI